MKRLNAARGAYMTALPGTATKWGATSTTGGGGASELPSASAPRAGVGVARSRLADTTRTAVRSTNRILMEARRVHRGCQRRAPAFQALSPRNPLADCGFLTPGVSFRPLNADGQPVRARGGVRVSGGGPG